MKMSQMVTRIMLLLIIFICSLVAAYGLTRQIFKITGQPPELAAYISTGLLAFIFLSLGGVLFNFLVHRLTGGKGRNFWRTRELTDILDAMTSIARGDFNVFVTTDDDRNPFSEVAESVNKMARELGSMEKLRQDFISNVSHEIQSPLTSVSGYASLLKHDGISPEQINHYATIIEAESQRLSKLSDNLLQLSVLEADSAPLDIKPFRLDKQLESIILMLEPQWSGKNITPDVSLPVTTMTGNEALLNQVWINLIHNAIKFTPENGSVQVRLTHDADNLVCTIADDGIGIAPEDQVHIFERFYKVDKSRDRSSGGSGLGLSLVKKIIELHSGRVIVESEPGKGSVFSVTIPQ